MERRHCRIIVIHAVQTASNSLHVAPHSKGLACYTCAMRRLIVNADDFGYTSGVNRAIVEAHTRGVVTSSTLMANGPAFAEAVSFAKNIPKLGVGCHVVLTDGEPVLGLEKIPSLTHSHTFRDGMKSFVARAIAGGMNEQE